MSRNMHPGAETSLRRRACWNWRATANAGRDDPKTLRRTPAFVPALWPRAGCALAGPWRFPPPGRAGAVRQLAASTACSASLMALLRAGDTLVTEQLTYPGLIGAARGTGIKLLGAAMDEEGRAQSRRRSTSCAGSTAFPPCTASRPAEPDHRRAVRGAAPKRWSPSVASTTC